MVRDVHQPVLLQSVLGYLDPKEGDIFIDATINGGGHSQAIAKRIGKKGKLLGIDRDCKILNSEELRYKIQDTRYKLVCASFANIQEIAQKEKFINVVGIVFDLGFSSFHIDKSERGFSFQKNEPLDMRYNIQDSFTATEIINSWPREKLEEIFKIFGEERYYRSIAKGIVETRKHASIQTTNNLVEVIRKSIPAGYRRGKIHFATRIFQALRIVVNNELEHITRGIKAGIDTLAKGGKITVISFHSLEDRIVKNIFRDEYKQGTLNILTKKPVIVEYAERKQNPRSRSAKLRAAEKI